MHSLDNKLTFMLYAGIFWSVLEGILPFMQSNFCQGLVYSTFQCLVSIHIHTNESVIVIFKCVIHYTDVTIISLVYNLWSSDATLAVGLSNGKINVYSRENQHLMCFDNSEVHA